MNFSSCRPKNLPTRSMHHPCLTTPHPGRFTQTSTNVTGPSWSGTGRKRGRKERSYLMTPVGTRRKLPRSLLQAHLGIKRERLSHLTSSRPSRPLWTGLSSRRQGKSGEYRSSIQRPEMRARSRGSPRFPHVLPVSPITFQEKFPERSCEMKRYIFRKSP